MMIVEKDNLIDLRSPIYLNEEQRERFIEFFTREFSECEVIDTEEPDIEFGDREGKSKSWETDEYLELMSPDTNEVIANRLKRSLMSVSMKRGDFAPAFIEWMKEKGYSMPATKENVSEFLKEVRNK